MKQKQLRLLVGGYPTLATTDAAWIIHDYMCRPFILDVSNYRSQSTKCLILDSPNVLRLHLTEYSRIPRMIEKWSIVLKEADLGTEN